MPKKPDHGPMDPRVRLTAQSIGQRIGDALPDGMGYALC
jgi:hypothetical protein